MNRKQRRIEAKLNRKKQKAASQNQATEHMEVEHLDICNDCRRERGVESCSVLWMRHGDIIEGISLTDWGDLNITFRCGCQYVYDPIREELVDSEYSMEEVTERIRTVFSEQQAEALSYGQAKH